MTETAAQKDNQEVELKNHQTIALKAVNSRETDFCHVQV